jgi:nitrite reductase/ring-hydroxylating ferredoxin subunit
MTQGRMTLAILLLMALSLLALSACSAQTSAQGTGSPAVAAQTLIKSQISGNSISISQSDVDKYTNTRFKVRTAIGELSFMAYNYNSKLNVRADICPPCRSESFTLNKGTLVCDTCGTVFDAQNGNGIRGACVRYPKQDVPYQIENGNLVMKDRPWRPIRIQ